MNRNKIEEYLEESGQSTILMDGFDEAFIGFSQRFNEPILAVYSWELMIDVLTNRDKMDFEEACEYIEFNIFGAWLGEQTPIIVMPLEY